MKNIKLLKGKLMILLGLSLLASGCTMFGLDVQKDYDYNKAYLDDHIHMNAWDYLNKRAKGPGSADTVFKWMQKAIIYSGIDTAEYTKPNRTYIFLHNDAIMKWDKATKKVTGGFFFNFPLVSSIDPGTGFPITEIAQKWERYNKETVKNYLLYLIAEGDRNFNNITIDPITLKTLLPSGTKAGKESTLGYMMTPASLPGTPFTAAQYSYDFSQNRGTGFNQNGELTLQLRNDADAKLYLNSWIVSRTAGYYATNGSIHVFDAVVYPSN